MNTIPVTPTAEQLADLRRQLQMPQTATDTEVIGALVNLVAFQYDQIQELKAALEPFGGVQFIVH